MQITPGDVKSVDRSRPPTASQPSPTSASTTSSLLRCSNYGLTEPTRTNPGKLPENPDFFPQHSSLSLNTKNRSGKFPIFLPWRSLLAQNMKIAKQPNLSSPLFGQTESFLRLLQSRATVIRLRPTAGCFLRGVVSSFLGLSQPSCRRRELHGRASGRVERGQVIL